MEPRSESYRDRLAARHVALMMAALEKNGTVSSKRPENWDAVANKMLEVALELQDAALV